MKKHDTVAMLLAGGQGSRLGGLTHTTAKPAVPFGGKYRLIDFPLSNCRYSDIEVVGVLTQYKPLVLNSYLSTGAPWALDTVGGGVHVLPPYMGMDGGDWYRNTADAIYQNIEFIDQYNPTNVIILSGDHIYKMDYSKMIDFHEENEADVTIAVMNVPLEDASRFGLMATDKNDNIIEFQEKPKVPKSTLASMGIYVFTWDILREELIRDHNDETSKKDFGGNIIPHMIADKYKVMAYRFDGYWRDVGTVESYYEASLELLQDEPPIDLNDSSFPIYSNNDNFMPHLVGEKAKVTNSLICDGCLVLGTVKNSILSNNVYVGEDVVIENSIVLHNSKIENSVTIKNAVVGENIVITSGDIKGNLKSSSDVKLYYKNKMNKILSM
ncbi:MAG: glucose-1-phosphate adenylyltransferase [Eubacteriales bacterium]